MSILTRQNMGMFSNYKIAVEKLKKETQEFKEKESLSNAATIDALDSLPAPFNSFGKILWDGIDGTETEKNDATIKSLEKIVQQGELKYDAVENKLEKLTKTIDTLYDNQIQSSIIDKQALGNEVYVNTLETSMKQQFDIWSSLYVQKGSMIDPTHIAKLDIQIKEILRKIRIDLEKLDRFLTKKGIDSKKRYPAFYELLDES